MLATVWQQFVRLKPQSESNGEEEGRSIRGGEFIGYESTYEAEGREGLCTINMISYEYSALEANGYEHRTYGKYDIVSYKRNTDRKYRKRRKRGKRDPLSKRKVQ